MLRHVGLLFAAMLTCMVVSQCKAATMEEIARVSWNKQSLAELERLLPDQKAVQQFATEVRTAERHANRMDNTYYPPEDVADYKFVELKGDESVQLVCLLDYTGRMRPTLLMAVENDQGHLKTAYLTGGEGGYGLGELRFIIRDLKHDGKHEVTLSDPLEPFVGGAVPNAYMEHIYLYQNGKFVPSDREFLDYYRNESLPLRRQELNDLLQHRPPPHATPEEQEDYRKSVDAKKQEIAALNKLLSKP
jgi:hypothetical protein